MAVTKLRVTRNGVNSPNYGPLYIGDVERRFTDPYGQKLGQDGYISHGNYKDFIFTGLVALSADRGSIKMMVDAGLISTAFI